jgi:hypothetical protein
MQTTEALPQLSDSLTAKRVYSEPYRENGITVITAAAVGGGARTDRGTAERDGGSRLGLAARPVGAYVLRNGRVVWKPAFDLSRIVLRGQLVLLTALLVLGFVLSRRGAITS